MKKFMWVLVVLAACSSDSESENNSNNLANNSNTSNNGSSNQTNNGTANNGGNNSNAGSNNLTNNSTNNSTNNGSNNTTNNQTTNPTNNGTNVEMDAGTDVSEMDAGMDTGDPYATRPLGQCAVNSDCPENPNGKMCNRMLPGGSCGNCDAFNDQFCDDTCFNGTCVTTCDVDDDCAPGLRCTAAGRCGAVACVNDVCPVPLFGCSDSGLCTRVACDADPSVCPSGTTCLLGVCIEDRQLPN